ncbi:divergent polysaccharide deacetylase family protein [Desulfotignum phosphitoxidans]|uniref:divergent polysaccharide deacetylase family protein n=1 Tax=Desulfotignum phosphitoxidans TaxID=190898 RepID=UPI00034D3172|nr:divergent polysaccharide deacetylase family protein [Desulfotignum phosphitoxidans]
MTSKKTSSRKTAGAKKTAVGKKPAAAKKPAGKKKSTASRRKSGKKPPTDLRSQLKKIGIGLMVLVAVCLTGAMVADLLIRQPKAPVRENTATRTTESPEKTELPKKSLPGDPTPQVVKDIQEADHITPQSGLMEKNGHPVLYEVFEETVPPPRPGADHRPVPESGDGLYEIALIIDDIGYDQKMAMALYALEPDISFSVLPWSPHGRAIAGILREKGALIMLHLPMEPVQYPDVNPGPGALLTSMSPDMLIAQLEKNIDEVPGASGVNNHMGSRLTAEAGQMYQVFTILKKRNLFFVDSMTAPKSQCRAAARLLQIPFSERDVFLDNIQEQAYITGQFAQLKKIARKHGSAIGIGHPYPATLKTLKAELSKIKGEFKIVPASRMVMIPG